MIPAKKQENGSYLILSGQARFLAELNTRGRAEVVDIENNKTLFVHEVGGELRALTAEAQQALCDATDRVIEKLMQQGH